MKRLTVRRTSYTKWSLIIIVLVASTVICLSQEKPRVAPPKKIQLPAPNLTGQLGLEQALANRRSVRHFAKQPLSFVQIGQLAWAGQGITEPTTGFRTAPSAGAIYPIKLYIATPEGLFVYNPENHSLEELSNLDIRERLGTAALQQKAVANAACDIIIIGSAKMLAPRYGNKAKRYLLLEAGHIAQNILLQAVSLDLASVPIGAFDVKNVSQVCRLALNLEPLYIICVGYPSKKTQ